MAGSARYTAILDANVLYPTLVRDLLLSLATAGLYHARWSRHVHDEWTRNLVANRPDLAGHVPDLVAAMNGAVPDCLVKNYQPLIGCVALPDPDDQHVLAAAIAGHADAIVTFNIKHFPADVLARHGIEAQHPDDFVMNQLQLQELVAIEAIKRMRARWKNPERSASELIAALEKRGLPLSAAHLKQAEALI